MLKKLEKQCAKCVKQQSENVKQNVCFMALGHFSVDCAENFTVTICVCVYAFVPLTNLFSLLSISISFILSFYS